MYMFTGILKMHSYQTLILKPQDSFGEFEEEKKIDLQKVQEIIKKHHDETFLQLFWMTYRNAILPSGKLLLCT